ncbi:hypothetical protein [Secundilactobacillus similis]|uniref:hypothetical protein n=1 Tax=Secundilactobacillus similis TaxID=414682 RepID=UPI0012E1BD7F|nr:hypothetical protein [Secundilactobacillus similis]
MTHEAFFYDRDERVTIHCLPGMVRNTVVAGMIDWSIFAKIENFSQIFGRSSEKKCYFFEYLPIYDQNETGFIR